MYTAFLYIEDDTGITWPSLVSWALDQQHLEPLGFSRGFYRTEVQLFHTVGITMTNATQILSWATSLEEGQSFRHVYDTRGSCCKIADHGKSCGLIQVGRAGTLATGS